MHFLHSQSEGSAGVRKLLGQGALLTCHFNHVRTKCKLGAALMEGRDEGVFLNVEDLPGSIFSCCLADVTKPFSHVTVVLSNAHGMGATLALPQEQVFISQHRSNIFILANTYNKPYPF